MDTRISTGALPPYHLKRLLLWAFCDGKPKSTLAKDIIVARIEANEELINRKVADYAEEYGLSVEALTEVVLQTGIGGKSFKQLHELLEKDVGQGDEAQQT
jgi:hypothetical protein